MGQVGKFLRSTEEGYAHYCPGCDQMHGIPTKKPKPKATWTFDGNFEKPTFNPSMNIGPGFCHYILAAGILKYQPDCHHSLKSKDVPLPELPEEYRDGPSP